MRLLRFSPFVPLALNLAAQTDNWRVTAPCIGKLDKWVFTEYQTKEMDGLLKTLKIIQPVQVKTAGEFLNTVSPMVSETTDKQNWQRFKRVFKGMRHQCMTCHAKMIAL